MTLLIKRDTKRFDGDNGLASLDVPNGLFSVTGSLEIAYEDDSLLRAANTGSAVGTDLTTTVFDESLEFLFKRGSGASELSVDLTIADAQITNYKVALKTDASPAVATFDFNSKRQTDVTQIITAVVKNQVPHADRSMS
jgi:hypothetical protein